MKHCEVSDILPKHTFQSHPETLDTLEESLLLYREVQHLLGQGAFFYDWSFYIRRECVYRDRNTAKKTKQRQDRHCEPRGVEDASHHNM